MPSWMWYIIGGAIVLLALGWVLSIIIGAFAYKKAKRGFDDMKSRIDRGFEKDDFFSRRR